MSESEVSTEKETKSFSTSGDLRTYQPPEGYVLLEQRMYDKLMELVYGDDKKLGRKVKTIYLKILRPYYLGDIKTQLNPGEIVDWVPRESLVIRGSRSTSLGSFLTIWNRQDPRSPRYDPDFPPIFDV